MAMTRQYLVGELLLLLTRLQAAAGSKESERAVARLCAEAESLSPDALGPVAVRALDLANALCWDSLVSGDARAFARQAEVCAALHVFGICAGLMPDAPGELNGVAPSPGRGRRT